MKRRGSVAGSGIGGRSARMGKRDGGRPVDRAIVAGTYEGKPRKCERTGLYEGFCMN